MEVSVEQAKVDFGLRSMDSSQKLSFQLAFTVLYVAGMFGHPNSPIRLGLKAAALICLIPWLWISIKEWKAERILGERFREFLKNGPADRILLYRDGRHTNNRLGTYDWKPYLSSALCDAIDQRLQLDVETQQHLAWSLQAEFDNHCRYAGHETLMLDIVRLLGLQVELDSDARYWISLAWHKYYREPMRSEIERVLENFPVRQRAASKLASGRV